MDNEEKGWEAVDKIIQSAKDLETAVTVAIRLTTRKEVA
jgi:hypothetical protein